MAEIRRTFSAGRMNKDIDERLLHPGEYRDALNVGVGHSESSDIGSVQNLLGNEYIGIGGIEGLITQGQGVGISEFVLTNTITVGIVKNDMEDKLYWLVASDEGSFIFEYDSVSSSVSTVLSDRNGILNFSSNNLITGINVLDGQLFWTDGATEPKKINIQRFKEGSTTGEDNVPVHTTVYGRSFIESDITVIKKNPLSAPTVNVSETLRPNGGTFNVTAMINFDGLGPGDSINVDVSTTGHAYLVGDNISLSGNATEGPVVVSVTIMGNDSLFELKFPRFAYRWKYIDGEYSTYSPFSEVAFITGQFEYSSEKGYNLGMTNNVRQMIVEGFDQAPDDAVELDILYKESNANPVYLVETISITSTSAEIKNDQIHAILPDNQILRPYDNVPKTALAQDIVSNRLVYGNYTHNYDVNVEPNFDISLSQRSNDSNQSIKSNRSYQVGVVYQDQYGRQTPVISNTTGSHDVSIDTADQSTELAVKIDSNHPGWATHYKYYVKETSTEYYNLALDRYYTGEDGFVWLSFPSSEFNKVNEESYIQLKKQHSSGGAVKDSEARYKVLDVRTEAPDFLTKQDEILGNIPYQHVLDEDNTLASATPHEGGAVFSWKVNPDSSYYSQVRANNDVKFIDNGGFIRYTISSVSEDPEYPGEFRIYTTESFGPEVSLIQEDGNLKEGIRIELVTEVREQLPEFIGRFFVKISRNSSFDTNVIETSSDDTAKYGVVAELHDIYDQVRSTGPGDDTEGFFFDFREEVQWKLNRTGKAEVMTRAKGNGIKIGSNRLDISYSGTQADGYKNPLWSNEFGDNLGRTGSFIRFVNSDNTALETVYKIVSVEHTAGPNLNARAPRGNSGVDSDGIFFTRREGQASTWYKRWSITLDKPIEAVPSGVVENVNQLISGEGSSRGSIEVVKDLSSESRLRSGGTPYVADPAIFETEPTGDDALDIYYETQETFPISQHNTTQSLKWYNCFSFGNGVESDRIRDDFNGLQLDNGARVSATISEPFMAENRPSGLIWSGIFNSITGVNNTNQFILAEGIQKELQPMFGSIQKLHARDTNLISFCEDKVVRILADKDALFNADGSSNLTASDTVLGQTTPFTGEYGISNNPESFSTYGSRIYFTDKNRGVILRLSQDGLTEISSKGMNDYFRDLFRSSEGKIITSFDDYHNTLNATINNTTVSYHEESDGWTSRKSFVPEFGVSLNNRYYTWNTGSLWIHNSRNVPRNNFYGVQHVSSITFIFNDQPGTVKKFLTLNYEGTKPKTVSSYDLEDNVVTTDSTDGGWFCPAMITDLDVGDARAFIKKEGKWFTNIGVLGGPEALIAVSEAMDSADITPGAEGSEEAMEEIEEFLEEIQENLDSGADEGLESLGPADVVEELPDEETGEVESQETKITINLV